MAHAPIATNPRIVAWQHRLLDLSRRNPLLSLPLARGLTVAGPDVWTWAAAVLSGKRQTLGHVALSEMGWPAVLVHAVGRQDLAPTVPSPLPLSDPLTSETATATGKRRLRWSDLPPEAHASLTSHASSRKVDVLLDSPSADDLQDSLAELYRRNRSRREETGIHTLYLAAGLLRWREADEGPWSDAPMFLIPVELERANVRAPFTLVEREEEVTVNPALSRWLKQTQGLDLDPVNQAIQESGLSTALKMLLEITKARSSHLRVLPEGRLVLLSYAKHRMWQDLEERAEQIINHPIIAQLLGDGASVARPTPSGESDWATLDKTHPPQELMLPLPADASQLRALVRIDKGESLVIKGPPGTGKSQTIANVIAHSLGRGRRVLFVAEKMTALDVVHRRLEELGLGAFCLELHASQGDKQAILRQLREGLDARQMPVVSGFEEAARQVHTRRLALNESLDLLHRVYPNGRTLYQAIGRLASMEEVASVPGMNFPHALVESAEEEAGRREQWRHYRIARQSRPESAAVFDVVATHPPTSASAWFEAMERALATVEELEGALHHALVNPTALPHQTSTLAPPLRVWEQVLKISHAWPTPAIVEALSPEAVLSWGQFIAADEEWKSAWPPCSNLASQELLWSTDNAGAAFHVQWLKAENAWAPLRWWRRRRLLEKWSSLTMNTTSTSAAMDQMMHAWPRLDTIRSRVADELRRWRSQVSSCAPQKLPQQRALATWAATLSGLLDEVGESAQELRQQVVEEVRSPGSHLLRTTAPSALSTSLQLLDVLQWLVRDLSPSLSQALKATEPFPPPVEHVSWDKWLPILREWLSARPAWPAWLAAVQQEVRIQKQGLLALAQAVKQEKVSWEDSDTILEAEGLRAFVHQVRQSNPEQSPWLGARRAQAIADYVRMDEEFENLTRRHLASQVAARLRAADLDQAPGMTLLRRELAKQRQHLPARRLLRELSAIIPVIKPCLMLSPLTAAEVLSSDTPPFDLVIFDEASQVPVAEAVGALSHARQVVIVGDPKQMPPTRRFAQDFEEDELDDEGTPKDLESILDECLASMDHVTLNWHYRSRHEDLIAFSNHRYYKGELITFPSSDAPSDARTRGVFVHRTQGVYDRATTQTNQAEAQAIVAHLRRHLMSDEAPVETIGVVTFNQRQQRLIERLWDAALRQSPELEERQSRLKDEVFVKNLESVQGDERDVILFSTTFGKDVAGKFPMNFGPLNLLGGERRLNVAITRARNSLHVYSSFGPEDMDVSALKHQGVRDLRDFLAFADGGQTALAAVSSPTLGLPDSPFEIAVATGLRARGWTVHEQVGCSGYKIDLAVIHPDFPGRYLAGVECDGATYHSFKIARDRDRQRQRILEGLGWHIERIWSTDWFSSPSQEMQRVDEALRALLPSDPSPTP